MLLCHITSYHIIANQTAFHIPLIGTCLLITSSNQHGLHASVVMLNRSCFGAPFAKRDPGEAIAGKNFACKNNPYSYELDLGPQLLGKNPVP